MWSPTVVEDEVLFHGENGLNWGVVGFDVYLFLFDGSPESFNEYIVSPSSSPIHTNTNMVCVKHIRENTTGEL
jgi:hypothetical protein